MSTFKFGFGCIITARSSLGGLQADRGAWPDHPRFDSPESPRDGSVERGCSKLTRNSNLRKFKEETPPKTKEVNLPPQEVVLNDSEAWTVINKETVVLQPRAKHTVLGKVQGGNSMNPS